MLFDIIAPVYKLFFNYQVRMYERDLEIVKDKIPFDEIKTSLGIGSGTGALCYVLKEQGLDVQGSEISAGMRKAAKSKLESYNIKVVKADVLAGLPFADDSYDMAIASFVAHGLKTEDRLKMYTEMKRVAKKLVVLVDFNENRSILTDIVETLEGGDYFNFIKSVKDELNSSFPKVDIIPTGVRSSWYVCYKSTSFLF